MISIVHRGRNMYSGGEGDKDIERLWEIYSSLYVEEYCSIGEYMQV